MFFPVRRLFECGLAPVRRSPDPPVDHECPSWGSEEDDRRLLLRSLRFGTEELEFSGGRNPVSAKWGPETVGTELGDELSVYEGWLREVEMDGPSEVEWGGSRWFCSARSLWRQSRRY